MIKFGNPKVYIFYIIIIIIAFSFALIYLSNSEINIDYTQANNITSSIFGTKYNIGVNSIPSIINGLTSSTSIIIGFTGVVLGILYKIYDKKETFKETLLIIAFFETIPLAYLFAVYCLLIMGYAEFSLRMSLVAVITALTFTVTIFLTIFYRFAKNNEKEKELQKTNNTKEAKNKVNNKVTFRSVMNSKPINSKLAKELSGRNLTLAGFSFSATTFLIGFYKNNLEQCNSLLTPFLVAMFLFFLGSQLAQEAEVFWQIFSSDLIQYLGIISVMISFTLFILSNLSNSLLAIMPAILIIVLIVYLMRGAFRLKSFYQKMKQKKL